MKNYLKIIISIILVLVIDLITKHFLFDVTYFNLIPNVISIATNGGNTGAGFGIFSGRTVELSIISVIMIIALLIFNHFVKNKNTFYSLGMGFVLGGALGNLYDRVFLGYVRDFIYLDFWPSFPTFNFADTFLCIGAVMLVIFILFMGKDKTEKTEKTEKKD